MNIMQIYKRILHLIAKIQVVIQTLLTNTTINNSGSTSSSGIVYWTPNGKSYHTTKSYSTLSRSKTILERTIQESGKNDPCDRCH